MKQLLATLLVILIVAPLAVGLIAGVSYYTTDESRVPQPSLVVMDQTLKPDGYDWEEPVFGGVITKQFSQPPNGQTTHLGQLATPTLSLGLPEGYTATATLQQDGAEVWTGSAEDLARYVFTDNGSYLVRLDCEKLPEEKLGTGCLSYQFAFDIVLEPTMSTSTQWVTPGGILSIQLSQMDSRLQPVLTCEAGSASFVQTSPGIMVAHIPIGLGATPGGYVVTITAGDYIWAVSMRVLETEYEAVDPALNIGALPDEEFEAAIAPLYATADETQYWSGRFQTPAAGEFGAGFGALLQQSRTSTIQHPGVDIIGPLGSAVKAPNNGRVVFAGYLNSTGNTLVIEHGDGLKSYLYHLGSLTVAVDDMVETGQQVGTLGSSGNTETPHLHYEVRYGERILDPIPLLNGSSSLFSFAH